MRTVRHPEGPDALRARLANLELTVRSLRARLAAALKERDALRLRIETLQSERDSELWRR